VRSCALSFFGITASFGMSRARSCSPRSRQWRHRSGHSRRRQLRSLVMSFPTRKSTSGHWLCTSWGLSHGSQEANPDRAPTSHVAHFGAGLSALGAQRRLIFDVAIPFGANKILHELLRIGVASIAHPQDPWRRMPGRSPVRAPAPGSTPSPGR
jgi:hypothetical protein